MYEILLPFLAFLSVTALGGAVLTARAARRTAIEQRLHAADAWAGPNHLGARGQHLVTAVSRIGERLSARGPSQGLKAELSKAGYHGSAAATVYLGAKMLLLLLGAGGLALLLIPTALPPSLKAIGTVGGACILFFVPNMVVSAKRRQRRLEIQQRLPDAFDLLEICVSAGMGLDMAWNCVTDEVRRVSPVLADEMALANLEMHLGASRATAMRHMAERTGADEIGSLVAVLVQSERFGTSIGETLRIFAESMRQLRSQRAEEAAEKMAVKLLFPMV